jgi:hypothetical protein
VQVTGIRIVGGGEMRPQAFYRQRGQLTQRQGKGQQLFGQQAIAPHAGIQLDVNNGGHPCRRRRAR